MKLERKYPVDQATTDIHALLDKKNTLPRRREMLEPAIETVAEAMSFGMVTISEDGQIRQKLMVPVGDVTELVYVPHVPAGEMQKAISKLQVYNQATVNRTYISAYTGLLNAQVDKIEPTDRTIADAIAFFCQ